MKIRLLALPFLLAAATGAFADSPFDGFLRGAAVDAARTLLTNGATGQQQKTDAPATPAGTSGNAPAATPVSQPATPAAAPKPGCMRTRAQPLPPLGPRPDAYQPAVLWPEDTGCDQYKFSDYKFDAARAQKKAFTDASRVRCSDCEGGYSYDAWAHFFAAKGGDSSKKFEQMLLGLNPGQSINWKGNKFAGSVQATGEHPIGSFPCRQYHWTLKDGGKVVAEREGLYCQYKGDYSTNATWHEIL